MRSAIMYRYYRNLSGIAHGDQADAIAIRIAVEQAIRHDLEPKLKIGMLPAPRGATRTRGADEALGAQGFFENVLPGRRQIEIARGDRAVRVKFDRAAADEYRRQAVSLLHRLADAGKDRQRRLEFRPVGAHSAARASRFPASSGLRYAPV